MLGGRPVHVALPVLLLAGSAIVAAGGLAPSTPADETAGPILVGELKLSDVDEAPRDAVSGTFAASNLAPGDTSRAYLGIHRETTSPTGPAFEPRVDVEIRQEQAAPLGDRLLVSELSYGGEDLRERAREDCGTPLTLERLATCSRSPSNPMADLPDPGPEGKRLWLGIEFDPRAESGQDQTVAFTVEVELHGQAMRDRVEPARTDTVEEPAPALPCRPAYDSSLAKSEVDPGVPLEAAIDELEIVDGVESVDAQRLFAGTLPSSVCQTSAVSG